ncbi:MAG: flavin oxidoreductase/NADH oxidase [Firmicutes bacterium]|nr:flavin oxidoreductase/NADH oxidase [Bacillota bacterium]
MQTRHERFRYRHLDELRDAVRKLDLGLEFDEDVSILGNQVAIDGKLAPNSLAIQPMEGHDGTPEGRPSELTFRRYRRFAEGGAGLIWFEATAITPEGRANPQQLMLNNDTLPSFRKLISETLTAARRAHGPEHRPFTVLQLTHSGRYSRPDPVIAFHDPYLDEETHVAPDQLPISDEELRKLEDRFVEAAKLAQEAGFDGVDIKHCHRYLPSELLSAHTRPGDYGGSFENRTRFLLNIVDKIKARLGDGIIVTTRINAYDAMPYPYGWGAASEEGSRAMCLEDMKKLATLLYEKGVRLLNITAGNPYHNPHVNRPYDLPLKGTELPDEHPLTGVARLIRAARIVQETVPKMVVIGSGYSWLRQFLGNAGAANIRNGWVTMVGVGRCAFAYPDFAADLLDKGAMESRKACITCSRCTEIMRKGKMTGCAVFDREVYGKALKS